MCVMYIVARHMHIHTHTNTTETNTCTNWCKHAYELILCVTDVKIATHTNHSNTPDTN